MTTMTRRELLKASGTAGLLLSAPAILSAQSKEPIPIGTLCPLTGAGGSYGPDMQRAVVAVVERINRAGGINGRPVQLFHEDDQTNAEAGVRAARKLIDVNKVVAIVSTWASAVTLAVKPLCVEAKVFVIGVSGADAVTQGDHKGYIARTQPNTNLQGRMYAKFAATKKEWKRVAYLALQTPYAVSFGDAFTGVLKAAGVTITDNFIYEDKKPSYRSEVTRVLGTNPGSDHARGLHAGLGRHGEGHLQGRLQGRDPRSELRDQREVHRGCGRGRGRGHLEHGPGPALRLGRPTRSSRPRCPAGMEARTRRRRGIRCRSWRWRSPPARAKCRGR